MIGAMVSSVLVVDDDRHFLALAKRILASMGIDAIFTAETAAAALAAADADRPRAVLVDVGLPDRDGIELAHQLAALPWSPRVVLTSTDRDAATAIDAPPATVSLPFLPKEDLTDERLRSLFSGT
jgi:DNA-binding response OmpR family regulator